MFPDPSEAPNGAVTEPVPLSGTAATVQHHFVTEFINTKLQKNKALA